MLIWQSLMHGQNPNAAMYKPKLSSKRPQLQADPGSNQCISASNALGCLAERSYAGCECSLSLATPQAIFQVCTRADEKVTCLGMMRVQMKKAPCFSSRTPARMPHDSTPLAVLRRE